MLWFIGFNIVVWAIASFWFVRVHSCYNDYMKHVSIYEPQPSMTKLFISYPPNVLLIAIIATAISIFVAGFTGVLT